LPRLPASMLTRRSGEVETSATVRVRVAQAREVALARSGVVNALLDDKQLRQHCQLDKGDRKLLETAIDQLGLSARAYHRVLRVSRSIADLAGDAAISRPQLIEALGYRQINVDKN
jgi:magnesium chelatase family protein